MITSTYPLIGFSKILTRVDRTITLADFDEYACVGVRLGGQGAYVREVKQGVSIKRKSQSVVHAGDVIFNKLFAWRGAFAIADQTTDGCIASDKFPIYSLDPKLVEPAYLRYWFQSRQLQAEARKHSKGAAALSKLTLNPPDFWKLFLPLPDITEQKRIIERLDALFEAYSEITLLRAPIDAVVQGRRAGIGSEARTVLAAELQHLNDTYASDLGILDTVLSLRPRSGPSFVCSTDGTGIGVVMPSALGGYRYAPYKVQFGNGTERIGQSYVLAPGDILISRGNKRDQVGLCIVYPDDSSPPRTYANLLMKMQVRNTVLPEFVKYWMMSPSSVRYIRKHTKGTSPSVQKINQRALINTPFPCAVPINKQKEWVRRLDTVFETVEEYESLVRDQHEDVKRFPDAILTAAFKGEVA